MSTPETNTDETTLEVSLFTQAQGAIDYLATHYGELLALADKQQLAIDDKTQQALDHLKQTYGDLSGVDAGTAEGYAFLKDGVKLLKDCRLGVDKHHKQLKEPILKITRVLDGTKNVVVGAIKEIEQPVVAAKKAQDELEERRKQERLARLDTRIRNEITGLLTEARGADSDTIAALMEQLSRLDPDLDFFDRTQEAHVAKRETLEELERLFSERLEQEVAKQQAEEEARKRRELEKQQLVDAAIHKLKAAPLDYMGKPAEEIREAIATFSAELKPGAFGDRHAEALQAQTVALAQLRQMAQMQEALEAQQAAAPANGLDMQDRYEVEVVEPATDTPPRVAELEPYSNADERPLLDPVGIAGDEPMTAAQHDREVRQPVYVTPKVEPEAEPVPTPEIKVGEETLTISVREYRELLAESRMLAALVANGVEDWDGYERAREELGLSEGSDLPI